MSRMSTGSVFNALLAGPSRLATIESFKTNSSTRTSLYSLSRSDIPPYAYEAAGTEKGRDCSGLR